MLDSQREGNVHKSFTNNWSSSKMFQISKCTTKASFYRKYTCLLSDVHVSSVMGTNQVHYTGRHTNDTDTSDTRKFGFFSVFQRFGVLSEFQNDSAKVIGSAQNGTKYIKFGRVLRSYETQISKSRKKNFSRYQYKSLVTLIFPV